MSATSKAGKRPLEVRVHEDASKGVRDRGDVPGAGSSTQRLLRLIRAWQGWLYLAVVLDMFSRKIVGWAAAPTTHRELVLNAVLAALRQRRPRGTLLHSEQGTQFGSDAWRCFRSPAVCTKRC